MADNSAIALAENTLTLLIDSTVSVVVDSTVSVVADSTVSAAADNTVSVEVDNTVMVLHNTEQHRHMGCNYIALEQYTRVLHMNMYCKEYCKNIDLATFYEIR